ncbi:MAG: hypothetical protein ACRC28_11220 [Clostridium sp.]|uniref:hypothetical protein n=1 Tax=Clostridium sp. TaxID=1506 RepID=UPI003F2C7944
MFKKKKGSTLVTVLAVAVVFMTIALAIITSIIGTMKTNINQKVKEDLRYAAESGLEIARSYLNGKSTITQEDINNINERLNHLLVDLNKDGTQDEEIGEVRLVSPSINGDGSIVNEQRKESEKNTANFMLKVRASRINRESIYEEVGVQYIYGKGDNMNIYEYGVIAGQNDIIMNNPALNDFTVNVSAGDKIIINGKEKEGTKYKKGNMFDELDFTENTEFTDKITLTKIDENLYPKSQYADMYANENKNNLGGFGFYDIKNKKKLEITEIEIGLKQQGIESVSIDGKKVTGDIKETIKATKKKSIVRIEVKNHPRDMTLMIFNSRELDIIPISPKILIKPNEPEIVDGELNLERYQGQTLALSNYIMINSGNINIKGNSTLSTYYTTIYGKGINIDKNASLDINTVSGTDGHGVNKNDESNFNKIFSLFIKNWDKENGLSKGKLNLKEKTFDN